MLFKEKLNNFYKNIIYYTPLQKAVSFLGYLYIKLVHYTNKHIIINQDYLTSNLKNDKPIILAFWHGRIMICIFANHKTHFLNKKFAGLASKHKDAAFIAYIMEFLNFTCITSSSANQSKKNLQKSSTTDILNLIRKIRKENYSLTITPDGPRGPAQQINGQISTIAKLSGAQIVPASFSCTRKTILKTWDKFLIPLPFSTNYVIFEKPITVDKNATKTQLLQLNSDLKEALNKATKKADLLAT